MIGVVAHECGQVESDGKSGLALREQVSETRVGVLCSAKAGELTHGPQPAAIHRWVNSARVRRLARLAQIAVRVPVRKISGGIKLTDGVPGYGGEALRTRRGTGRFVF